jgi:hypothetical protein
MVFQEAPWRLVGDPFEWKPGEKHEQRAEERLEERRGRRPRRRPRRRPGGNPLEEIDF